MTNTNTQSCFVEPIRIDAVHYSCPADSYPLHYSRHVGAIGNCFSNRAECNLVYEVFSSSVDAAMKAVGFIGDTIGDYFIGDEAVL
jgi:hypothetical protein